MFVDKFVNYKKWFFGHYHFDTTISKQKECIYQRIINLNKKKKMFCCTMFIVEENGTNFQYLTWKTGHNVVFYY